MNAPWDWDLDDIVVCVLIAMVAFFVLRWSPSGQPLPSIADLQVVHDR